MKEIYLHEFNILMPGRAYLPNATGMLRAYAETKQKIKDNYIFKDFVFKRDKVANILKKYQQPAVLGFSSSLWNHELNLAIARRAKAKFPHALIVFGGPHAPKKAAKFLQDNPFVDIVVRGEGEETFAEILETFATSQDFSQIAGLNFIDKKTGQYIETADRPLLLEVDKLPSPYLQGLYDTLLDNRGDYEYQMILETNRGCPFGCAFCYWGNANRRIRLFDLQRIKAEIDWLSRHKIKYVFGADANYGMVRRDYEIAEMFVTSKKSSGYPAAFRVCYGKNAEDNIFEIAKLLDQYKLATGVTLSFQSTNPKTLEAIHRANISLDTYLNLQKRYHAAKIPVYTELILGLPHETYDSFKQAIESVMQSGMHDQIGIFFCTILPNTDMADPDYAKKYGIVSRKIDLVEIHSSKREEEIMEYENISVGTKSMPKIAWQRTAALSWLAQTLHGLKLGFFVSLYLFNQHKIKYTELFEYLLKQSADPQKYPVLRKEMDFFDKYINDIFKGRPQCVFLDDFGDISWQIEEATFLRLAENLDKFYQEFLALTLELLKTKNIKFDEDQLKEVFRYQEARMSTFKSQAKQECDFTFNIPQYFDALLKDKLIAIKKDKVHALIEGRDFDGNKQDFAREIIWYGRRDSRAVNKISYNILSSTL